MPKIIESVSDIISTFTNETAEPFKKKYFNELKDELSLKLVFSLYRLSYLCYQKSSKAYSAVYQYKKMLYILKDSLSKKNHKYLIEEDTIDSIASIILKHQVAISGASNRIQLIKYREYTDYSDVFTQDLYNNLSTSPEVKEIIMLIEGIKVKLGYIKQSSFYVGEYSTISSMFTRILELKFKADQEMQLIKEFRGDRELVDIIKQFASISNIDMKEFNEFRNAIINSFFCLYEVLRTLKTYGIDYILNYSFNGAICQRMSRVCLFYDCIKKIEELNANITSSIEEDLKELLGDHFIFSTDPYEYLDLAKQHYRSAIDLHSEGAKYKEISKEMYFLDDDYNDNLTHFCAASERYRINTGRIENALKTIENDLITSDLINYNKYVE